MKPRKNKLVILLFLMFFYIIAQLGWWAFLISRLTSEVYANDPRLDYRIAMVWGEGLVFALILLFGFLFTYKSYLKELVLVRQQRNFLMSVTHEFKTPIASLKLYLQTLQSRSLTDEQKQSMLEKALNDVDRLNALSENILLASSIDQRAYPLVKKNQSLSVYLEELITELKSGIGKEHRTTLEISPEIYFSFDVNAMHSIVSNLYGNAIKYSPAGSAIHVSLKKEENVLVLKFSDEGIGIPPSERKAIFGRFTRLGNEETRNTKGTGLGLFIVDQFVKWHKGTITVDSNSPSGSIFSIHFPT